MAKYCCGDFYLAGFGVETDGADVFGLARATEAGRRAQAGTATPPH